MNPDLAALNNTPHFHSQHRHHQQQQQNLQLEPLQEEVVSGGWVIVMAPKNQQWVTHFDGVEKLELVDGEMPVPGEGEVLVEIRAVGLNYRDIEVVSGEYNHNPQQAFDDKSASLVPCSDMCGTVSQSNSPLLKPGTRVASVFLQKHLSGALKESDMDSGLGLPLQGVLTRYRCFDARALVKVPDYLSDEEACCLPIASVTAWMALNWMRPVGRAFEAYGSGPGEAEKDGKKEPETVLLQGTGGVSIAGLQIAKAAGLRTIITSSSDEKLQRAKEELGADVGINYRTHWEWQDPVMKATDGKGADYILELGGAKTLRKSFASVAFGGTINCIGYLSGKEDKDDEGDGNDGKSGEAAQWNRLNVNVLALRRNVTLKGLINGGKDRFEEMLRFYEEKKIRPVVCKTFKLEEAKEAMAYVAEGKHFGKVVIKIGEQ